MSNAYLKRVKQLQKTLRFSALWIENPVDVGYLTGVQLSTGVVIITKKAATLHVDGRYTQAAKANSAIPVRDLEPKDLEESLPTKGKIGFAANQLTFGRVQALEKAYGKRFAPVQAPLDSLRIIKDADELKRMRKSAKLLWAGFEHLCSRLKTGVTEREAMLSLEHFVKSKGATGMSFDPIIAFGENTAMPHYHTGDARLKKSDIVLVDAGVIIDGYCSDMTRTFFVGKPILELVPILQTTIKAQKAALEVCKPGKKLKELDLAARSVMAKEGLEEYFVHSLGHGIGLDVHERPRLSSQGADKDVILQEGMVVTIEPGLYVPGLGGARWEDTVAITKAGHQNFYPRSLDFCSKLRLK